MSRSQRPLGCRARRDDPGRARALATIPLDDWIGSRGADAGGRSDLPRLRRNLLHLKFEMCRPPRSKRDGIPIGHRHGRLGLDCQ